MALVISLFDKLVPTIENLIEKCLCIGLPGVMVRHRHYILNFVHKSFPLLLLIRIPGTVDLNHVISACAYWMVSVLIVAFLNSRMLWLFSSIDSHSPITEGNNPMHQFWICSSQIDMYLFFITFYIISPYIDNKDGIHLYSSPDCFISHFQTILNIYIINGRILKVIISYFVISCIEFISCCLPVFYSKFISSSLLLYCNASVY
jgi:hypothetical protein